ncbi:hypothetical protein DSO57_1019608 [Entomophthora muscae]|uniref:Uncharacterized protein n=1 Tax=Entomophthora muscae TaxID=34485 RepID=A0ACC2U2M4_9FUNG|nr:hypothetical protein DSO57_1019608 [Entomophthora muscae]
MLTVLDGLTLALEETYYVFSQLSSVTPEHLASIKETPLRRQTIPILAFLTTISIRATLHHSFPWCSAWNVLDVPTL